MDKRQIKRNIILSIAAQLISFGVGFILNLIAPKYIPDISYANWQTYALYASYVGILHFGLIDGIVLRYAQYDYDQLDKTVLRSQFKLLLLITGTISLLLSAFSIVFIHGTNRYIVIFVALAIIEKNIYTYTSYTLQMTNRINRYATLVVSNRVVYGILVILILLSKHYDYYWFCLADIVSDIVGTIMGMCYNKGLYLGKSIPFRKALDEAKFNIFSGFMILTANWSSMFLTSSSKMIIQWRWSESAFARIAFAFSLSNLFLQFVNAASVVLFPSLKRMNPEELPRVYKNIRMAISPILFAVLIFYFPGCWILDLWIPRYSESLKYLGIILPMIVFSSKVSLLTNNYFKSYRKEKQMLKINIYTVLLGIVLYVLAAYVINSITTVLFMVILAIMLRSMVSEIIISKTIGIEVRKDLVIELVMTIGFLISSYFLKRQIGLCVYSVLVTIYMIIYRKEIYLNFFAKKTRHI